MESVSSIGAPPPFLALGGDFSIMVDQLIKAQILRYLGSELPFKSMDVRNWALASVQRISSPCTNPVTPGELARAIVQSTPRAPASLTSATGDVKDFSPCRHPHFFKKNQKKKTKNLTQLKIQPAQPRRRHKISTWQCCR
ncbi:myotubularin-related protein 9 [Platysternon megacephalum]|uniref:Myotubularin-related protein 9 n=1 Tax=Platysternon megacephalum TaxID=55544 RepID=A0A4D9DVH2_9SAUR|nr:myotubularin-related protein 9 [Platysternon megacephalum]